MNHRLNRSRLCQTLGVVIVAATIGIVGSGRTAPTYSFPPKRFPEQPKTCFDISIDKGGSPGALPPNYYSKYGTDDLRKGLCTWYLWVGGDPLRKDGPPDNARGNPRFWRQAEKHLTATAKKLKLPIALKLLERIDSRDHDRRFEQYGLINQPGCKKATRPDEYGLWLDECPDDPYSSGIIGIRVFPNPSFDANAWDPTKYRDAPNTEPPYLVGLTCGICHIAFNPIDPPKNLVAPNWDNLAPNVGNQYIKEGEIFMAGLRPEHFQYWVYKTQEPGTSDTSRISTDFINNPSTINSIYFITSHRPTRIESMNDGSSRKVPRILKDGSDSIGPAGAAMRVYVNIGTCGDYRASLEDIFVGLQRPQQPFDLQKAEDECDDWRQTRARMGALADFLDQLPPYPLEDALQQAPPRVRAAFGPDAEKVNRGKKVFGANCARCHSSKLPPGLRKPDSDPWELRPGIDKHDPQFTNVWANWASRDDFLQKNFLSDDERYPVISQDARITIGTNAARALGTNPREGHIWRNFSSETFKRLPSPGTLSLYNPFGGPSISLKVPEGAGYYRTPSLISIWATAPFLHNNSLGCDSRDPSVEGRLRAFMDASEKLLWPEKRQRPCPGAVGMRIVADRTVTGSRIKATPVASYLTVPLRIWTVKIRVPAGTPVNLLANIDFRQALQRYVGLGTVVKLLTHPRQLVTLIKIWLNTGQYDAEFARLIPTLLELNQAPDFLEDEGHTFGSELSDREKWALIEYMKTL